MAPRSTGPAVVRIVKAVLVAVAAALITLVIGLFIEVVVRLVITDVRLSTGAEPIREDFFDISLWPLLPLIFIVGVGVLWGRLERTDGG